MSMCIGTNNVDVIGKMIPKFCYSHLIMSNTLYTCTVQVRVLYTVQYRVYYYFWARFNFIWGVCTLYSTECIIIFLLGSILLGGGGLSPPSPNDAPPLFVRKYIRCLMYILYGKVKKGVSNFGSTLLNDNNFNIRYCMRNFNISTACKFMRNNRWQVIAKVASRRES